MPELERRLEDFIRLVESGRSVDAIERYYAPEVVVRENRTLARVGKEDCLEFERAMLQRSSHPPKIRCVSRAVDAVSGTSFIEWRIRFVADDGHVMLLEEVAVAKWDHAYILEERFYYEGFVDEGPADDDFA